MRISARGPARQGQRTYGWRGGNPEILRAINSNIQFNDTSKSNPADDIGHTTRRCSAPIVDFVNAFLNKDKLIEYGEYFSAGAAQKWAESFRQHVSKAKDKEFGEAMWVRLKDVLTISNNIESFSVVFKVFSIEILPLSLLEYVSISDLISL
jgi:hypothetical protein